MHRLFTSLNQRLTTVLALATLPVMLLVSAPSHSLDVSMENDLLMFGGVTTVTITGPNGFRFFSDNPDEVAFITLDQIGIVQDGTYRYSAQELALGDSTTVTDPDNGRTNVEKRAVKTLLNESGTFTVVDGIITPSDMIEPESEG